MEAPLLVVELPAPWVETGELNEMLTSAGHFGKAKVTRELTTTFFEAASPLAALFDGGWSGRSSGPPGALLFKEEEATLFPGGSRDGSTLASRDDVDPDGLLDRLGLPAWLTRSPVASAPSSSDIESDSLLWNT